MTSELGVLVTTAFSVGFLHTLVGPDHYVPFVAMSRTNRWTRRKTVTVTACCGIGHVASSVIIGAIGLAFGTLLMQVESLESARGDLAAWLLIGFGLAYLTWGIMRGIRNLPHAHLHSHSDGTVHSHLHQHDLEHRHLHRRVDKLNSAGDVEFDRGDAEETGLETIGVERTSVSLTPWLLFLIFAFGPCEVLVPLLMYPAAESDFFSIAAVILAFSLATIGTMIAVVMAMVFGLNFVRVPGIHRYSHALAGFAVFVCGLSIKFGF